MIRKYAGETVSTEKGQKQMVLVSFSFEQVGENLRQCLDGQRSENQLKARRGMKVSMEPVRVNNKDMTLDLDLGTAQRADHAANRPAVPVAA
jgi:secreted protein with Ig-like and vWFA domain